MEPTQVYGVGKPWGKSWKLMGVFTTQELALESCLGDEYFTIGPLYLDSGVKRTVPHHNNGLPPAIEA